MMWLVGLSLSAYAVQTIDAPHVNLDSNEATEDCSTCHFSTDLATGAAIVPGSTCVGCHTSDLGGYTDTTAPLAATHQGFPCETCHNPHVSQQYGITAPLVSGTLSAVTPGTTQTTMTVAGVTGISPWPATPSMWTAKSINGMDASQVAVRKVDRGLILWVTVGADSYSYEVKDTSSYPSITVKGVMPAIADGTAFELHYGELLANKVTPGTSYRYGTSPVTHTDASGNPEFVDATTNDGICQTCHTTTRHYTNSAPETSHHVGETCTKCHLHSNGFTPDTTQCANCHTTYPEPPPTGMHTLHASTSGYNFPCEVCHKGGMTSWNPGPNDKLQIGFNLVPLGTTNFSGANTSYDGMASGTLTPPSQYGASGYQGENETTVTTGGSLTCSNIYCHSNGYSAGIMDDTSGASIPSQWTSSTLDTTPKWDGSSVDADGNACNNCHDNGNFPAATFTKSNYNTAASHALPGYNVHWPHALFGVGCMYCHNNTVNTSDSTLITGKASHANGIVNVKSGGSYGGNAIGYTYDPTSHSCFGTVQCHAGGRVWKNVNRNDYGTADDVTYPVVAATPNVDQVLNYTVTNYDSNTLVLHNSSTDDDYINPIKNAAYGGGYNGKNGVIRWISVVAPSTGTMAFPVPVHDVPVLSDVYRTFPDTAWNYTAIPGSTVINFNFTLMDNSPDSKTNRKSKITGPGVGYKETGWVHHVMDPVDETVINNLPIIQDPIANVTNLGGGSFQVDLSDQTIDKDWNDPAKNALFGGGHDGTTAARIKVIWFEGANLPANNYYPILQDVPTNTVMSHVFTGVSSGQKVFYELLVWDSHYRNANSQASAPTVMVDSGWISTILP